MPGDFLRAEPCKIYYLQGPEGFQFVVEFDINLSLDSECESLQVEKQSKQMALVGGGISGSCCVFF